MPYVESSDPYSLSYIAEVSESLVSHTRLGPGPRPRLTAITASVLRASRLSTSNMTPHNFQPAEKRSFEISGEVLDEAAASDRSITECREIMHARQANDSSRYGGMSS